MVHFSRKVFITGVLVIFSHGPINAFAQQAPYPPSQVITDIAFEPVLDRQALGSDNWPLTWGDDDKLYTAFGDGEGFSGNTRYCLGTARVTGDPTNFYGENREGIQVDNSPPVCIKAAGILMVDGVLYLWSRKDGARLWKSNDHGQSWQDTGITIEQPNRDFYSTTFLQNGKNYAGNTDNYVYAYGTNQKGAADSIFLFRMPKDKVAVRSAYTFYAGLDSEGNPVWSSNVDDRQHVFLDSLNAAVDPRVVYNPGIQRYIMTTWFGGNGGIGIFDAPAPWGPWTTVFYTANWDQGFTFEYNFPSKWISSDGKIMYMVFSGVDINDAFVVRKTILSTTGIDTVAPSSPTDLNAE